MKNLEDNPIKKKNEYYLKNREMILKKLEEKRKTPEHKLKQN